MKKFVKIMMLILAGSTLSAEVNAQKKKTTKKTSAKTTVVKFKPMEFATPDSTVMLKDVADTNAYYASVNNLIGKRGVILSYADSTFRPNDPLRRGDFIVSFNSALNTIRSAMDSGMLDTTLV
ncbi:MAG: S-layer homology domain-containing protein, partial [Ginsengibacter sp.]